MKADCRTRVLYILVQQNISFHVGVWRILWLVYYTEIYTSAILLL